MIKRHCQFVVPWIDPFNRIDLRCDYGLDLVTRQQCEEQNTDRPTTGVTVLTAKRADFLEMWGVHPDLFNQNSARRRRQVGVHIRL